MSKEHPDSEAFAVQGNAHDVGAVIVFAFHKWPASIFDSSSPTLPLAGFGGFFAPCEDFCLHISWVQQDCLFHHGLSTHYYVFSKLLHSLSLSWVCVCSLSLESPPCTTTYFSLISGSS